MKNIIYIICILFLSATFLSSCNKKLKEDLESMEKELAELRDRENQTRGILGSNEPINITSTFVNDDDEVITIVGTYNFKSSDYETQYMEELSNGTYEIKVERFSDVDWYEGAFLRFTYDPTTKNVSNIESAHYWDDNDIYSDQIRYIPYVTEQPEIDLTIHSINITDGSISFTFNASGDAAYTNDVYNNYSSSYVPNPNQPVTTKFSFTGKLKVFEYVENNAAAKSN